MYCSHNSHNFAKCFSFSVVSMTHHLPMVLGEVIAIISVSLKIEAHVSDLTSSHFGDILFLQTESGFFPHTVRVRTFLTSPGGEGSGGTSWSCRSVASES